MATRATIRSQVKFRCGNHVALTDADVNSLLESDNQEIVEAASWSWRQAWTKITTIAPATITVGVVNGSATVTSASFTAAMTGRLIRIGGESDWYQIGTVVVGVSALLTDSDGTSMLYSGTTDTAASATVFKHIYRVSTNAERIIRAVSNVVMSEIDPDVFNNLDPELTTTADPPFAWCHANRDSSGSLQIGFFSPPSAAVGIRVDFLKIATMTADADVTLYPSVLLMWRTAESAAAFLLAKTGDQAWASIADRYAKAYKEALAEAKSEDLLRQSPPTSIREQDAVMGIGSDEFALSRDVTFSP
jgi:hypothetical protein